MEIRTGQTSEIENFQLYDEDNDGSEIIVVEDAGQVVAYAQYNDLGDDAELAFMEADNQGQGCGRLMMDWFKARYEHVTAVNVEKTAEGFYSKLGFERCGSDGFNGFNMDWWLE